MCLGDSGKEKCHPPLMEKAPRPERYGPLPPEKVREPIMPKIPDVGAASRIHQAKVTQR